MVYLCQMYYSYTLCRLGNICGNMGRWRMNTWIYPRFYDSIHAFGFMECFTTTFLHTHHSLLAKLGQWGRLMRMRLAWNKCQKTLDTSKRLHQYKTRSTGGFDFQLSHHWELQDSETGRVVTPWRVLEVGEIPAMCTTHHGTVGGRETPVQGLLLCLRIIYIIPPSRPARPHQVAFYDMQGEGCLLFPRCPTVTLLLDIRPEAGYTFATFGSDSIHAMERWNNK